MIDLSITGKLFTPLPQTEAMPPRRSNRLTSRDRTTQHGQSYGDLPNLQADIETPLPPLDGWQCFVSREPPPIPLQADTENPLPSLTGWESFHSQQSPSILLQADTEPPPSPLGGWQSLHTTFPLIDAGQEHVFRSEFQVSVGGSPINKYDLIERGLN